jgi:hypothetical protein
MDVSDVSFQVRTEFVNIIWTGWGIYWFNVGTVNAHLGGKFGCPLPQKRKVHVNGCAAQETEGAQTNSMQQH